MPNATQISGLSAIVTGSPVRAIRRYGDSVEIVRDGAAERFDHAVIATHSDQALRLLQDPDGRERAILGAIGYRANEAVLHSDESLMPRRKAVWSSWNYAAEGPPDAQQLSVTYWMNRLQHIADDHPLFVTLNPIREPDPAKVIRRETYDHPVFDTAAGVAQAKLWSLQGVRNTWFCGAYFGAGFHEDGLQAGLAVAEQLGGVRRPWTVENESGRIQIGAAPSLTPKMLAA